MLGIPNIPQKKMLLGIPPSRVTTRPCFSDVCGLWDLFFGDITDGQSMAERQTHMVDPVMNAWSWDRLSETGRLPTTEFRIDARECQRPMDCLVGLVLG